jgi:16S rRNA (cytidine1402-2'-O)-methyltransferase
MGEQEGASVAGPQRDIRSEGPARSGKRGYFIRGQFFAAPALDPGLYVVATPIGNLSDITIRALDTIAGADLLACEDTRVTRKLLTRYGIEAKVVAYHEHSDAHAHRRLLETVAQGGSVAVVSDAGTPLISDPGGALVRDAAEAGYPVIPIPGPSSTVAALSAAGLPTDAFLFLGFLPHKSNGRRKRLGEVAGLPLTLVLFESPNRIGALLADAVAELGAARQAAICREITKLHETFARGTLGELAGQFADADTKGEVVLVIGPPAAAEAPSEADVDGQIAQALRSMSVKEAAQAVSGATGLTRREVYQRALQLKARG